MSPIKQIFKNNTVWAESIKEKEPNFFTDLAKGQKPEYLWIGCSDSRVPPNQVINLGPGEIFVHRNIANQIIHTDMNCMSVLQYAVNHLKVKHIIICGHYGCGGVEASIGEKIGGVIDQWLFHVKKVFQKHKDSIDSLENNKMLDRLCELNVIEQVSNISNVDIVKNAWESGQSLTVHGLIFDLKTGLLTELDKCTSLNEPENRV